MKRLARLLAPVAFAVLCGCTRGAVLRVRPPSVDAGDAADAQRRAAEDALRDVAKIGRLRCETPKDGHELLGCWPEDFAVQPRVSLHLASAPDGYRVSILVSDAPSRVLCAAQERLVERLEFRLGGHEGLVQRDPNVSCPRPRP